jgi:hypothetical protein
VIVSHKRQFVFVKTRKTAGTSIELQLSTACGPGDIVIRVGAAEEELRSQMNGYVSSSAPDLPFRAWMARDFASAIRQRRRPRFKNHTPAAQIRRALGASAWADYLTFAVERNPWDRAISRYWWDTHKSGCDQGDINDWVLRATSERLSNFSLYSVGGKVIVDRLLPYERLEVELEQVLAELRIPVPSELPRAKSGLRRSGHWRDALKPPAVERIASVCHREIDLLGYEP